MAVAVAAMAQSLPPRRAFEIATGPVAGSHFPAGELIARIVSHPPGLARCEKSPLCGPPGVVVSAKSSDGAVANVLAVNSGEVASGLAQANVVADAVAGRGPFQKLGKQSRIRVMADLYGETLHLVVAKRSSVRSLAGLRGKRISIGLPRSGTDVIAEKVLSAYGVKSAKIVRLGPEESGGLLREGKIDAFFYLGAAPDILIADMVGRGQARLIPIDGKRRARLIAASPGIKAETIAPGAYRGAPGIETIGSRTLWIVRDSASADTVYGLVRALYHSGNRAMLQAADVAPIWPGPSPALTIAPLHPGAVRYWRSTGHLKR